MNRTLSKHTESEIPQSAPRQNEACGNEGNVWTEFKRKPNPGISNNKKS